MINEIKEFCEGSKLDSELEQQFLKNPCLKSLTGVNTSNNSGKISEWYVKETLKNKNIKYIEQPIIRYGKRHIRPDFYLPDLDLFVEVKSRTYNCVGTASEKADNISRKYNCILPLTEKYKKSKVLIVFCAGELLQSSTQELINYRDLPDQHYTRRFIELSKEYSILDWIDIKRIGMYLVSN